MTQGTIARWEKKEGESFTAGELLLQIETDKAQMDVEAQEDGVLVKILAPEGAQNVAVNTAIAIVAEEGDDLGSIDVAALSGSATAPAADAAPAPAAAAPAQSAPAPLHAGSGRSARELLSPAVAFAIHSQYITNPGDIRGSGPNGRILKGDVIEFVKAGRAAISAPAAPAPAPAASRPAASKPGAAAPRSADAETAFLVQALEPSVLRQLAAQELARRTTTVQVPAEPLARAAKTGGAAAVDALAVRAAALALLQVQLGGAGAGVGVAVDGGRAPAVAALSAAASASVHDLAAEIKSVRAAGQAAGSMPAVVVAPEGLFTPATLPAAAVVVVGQPRPAVSAAAAAAALDGALEALTGTAKRPAAATAATKRPAQVVDVHVISTSPAAPALAGRIKSLLSSPELLGL
ncbi:hypothetical protein IWQ57_000380 [Coemansia nantahalensis]|uniref:Uncharacterized protein n=1 Tax=Coemansia nantahalensis TaxID=2789366 RepID=A0ACC1K7U1_9FUNG|nr:hypothetical protein IWQ57_000380 [Coemansia nantahalensis]